MIYTVVGARPNFIKLDPDLPQEIIHTGQHFDPLMSDAFFDGLGLPTPKYNLGCKGSQVGKMIDKMRPIFRKEKPEIVLVFGDTNSSLAGALAAKYEGFKVAHVESGMRCGKWIPEEINRVTIDHLADVNFPVSINANMNLLIEGITENVYSIPDPLIDVMMRHMPIPATSNKGKYSLVTIHREENANKAWLSLFLKELGKIDRMFVFPAHPRIKKMLKDVPRNVAVIAPQTYSEMLSLQANAALVITDSGGIQRESAWLNIPVIVMRAETEWKELVTANKVRLSNIDNLQNDIQTFKASVTGAPAMGANKAIKETLARHI